MSKSKKLYLEILRIISCLFVLLNHTISFVNPISDIGILLKDCLFMGCKVAVPLFFMISGYLLLSKDYSFKEILQDKVLRMIIVLIISVILVYLVLCKSLKFEDYLLQVIAKPTPLPLWYLYVLVGLYLMVPFIRKIVVLMKNIDYIFFFILVLVIPGTIPLIEQLLKINVSDFFTKALFSGYIGYFVMGYYVGKKSLNKKECIVSLVIGILTYVLSVVWIFIEYKNNGINSLFLDNILLLTTVLPSISFFVLIKYVFENFKFGKKMEIAIKTIGGTTFGVYLFHILIMTRWYNSELIQELCNINQFLGVGVLIILMFVFLSLLTYFLKKVPVIKKYL